MAASELSYSYVPLMDCFRVEVVRGGYSAACWVNSVEEVEKQRESLEAAINRMVADQDALQGPSSVD